jgi:hypothetical protein
VAELGGDARLEVLGDHMFERLGLVVYAVPGHVEVLGEVELEQAVVAQHLEREALALDGEPRPVVGGVFGQAAFGELLDHHRGRRGGDPEPLGEIVGVYRSARIAALECVDRLGVVFDRLRRGVRSTAAIRRSPVARW